MLILLPPSEGKSAPSRGRPLDLTALSFPCLTQARAEVLQALLDTCRDDPGTAAGLLGLGRSQHDMVERNASLDAAPTARVDAIYTGVLYDALALPGLSPAARRRATRHLAITSALFGIIRPSDRIPAYRLSGDVSLPTLGPVAAIWREHLGTAVTDALGGGLLVDLRSGTYAAFWRPPKDLAGRVATVRVLHESDGRRKVVSHFNKATKGRIVRALLEAGVAPGNPRALADALVDLGWTVEVGDATAKGTQLDVVVAEI